MRRRVDTLQVFIEYKMFNLKQQVFIEYFQILLIEFFHNSSHVPYGHFYKKNECLKYLTLSHFLI